MLADLWDESWLRVAEWTISGAVGAVASFFAAWGRWKISSKKVSADIESRLFEQFHKLSEDQRIRIKQLEERSAGERELFADRARLRAEINFLRSQIEQMQEEEVTNPIAEAVIVANQDAIIFEWSPSATSTFHWTARQAIGKSITMLITPEDLERYKLAWKNLLQNNRSPRRGPFLVTALTKEGTKIPVSIVLSGWEEANGTKMFSARVRLRTVNGNGNGKNNTLP